MRFQMNWLAFAAAFVIGLAYVYVVAPQLKVITKFPSPDNAGKVVYEDASGECFTFTAHKLDACPQDAVAQPVTWA